MKRILQFLMLAVFCVFGLQGCIRQTAQSIIASDSQDQLANIMKHLVKPVITGWELTKLVLIQEARDKPTPTFLYVYSPYKACFLYVGNAIGFPIPNSDRMVPPHVPGAMAARAGTGFFHGDDLPEPNGVFTAESSDATWVLINDPSHSGSTAPQYFEDHINATTVKLPERVLCPDARAEPSQAVK